MSYHTALMLFAMAFMSTPFVLMALAGAAIKITSK